MFDPRGPTFFELADQALSSTTKGYDMLAPKFEYTPFRTPDEVLEEVADAIGPPGSIEWALDLCCGTGAAMRMLRPKCTEGITGVDLSQGMLDEAELQLEMAPGQAEIQLLQGDILELEYERQFDVVTTFGAFGHILHHQQECFAKRVWTALRPGGRFIFVTAPMPSILSPRWWVSRSFNALMHIRNALVEPPFIMFYLTFTLERARKVLEKKGFEIDVRAPFAGSDFEVLRLLIATKPDGK